MQLFRISRPKHLIVAAPRRQRLSWQPPHPLPRRLPYGRRAGRGETAVVVSGGMTLAQHGAVRAAQPAAAKISSCHSITYKGSAGAIHVQTSKSGYVAWGIYMYNSKLDAGPWNVDVYVGKTRVDHKDQNYALHGSVNPKDAKKGKIFHITATHHANANGKTYGSVPNECVIP